MDNKNTDTWLFWTVALCLVFPPLGATLAVYYLIKVITATVADKINKGQ